MNLDTLTAIGALDGRYRSKVEPLAPVMSEFGLLHARVEVECRWFETLGDTDGVTDLPRLGAEQRAAVAAIYRSFDLEGAARRSSRQLYRRTAA